MYQFIKIYPDIGPMYYIAIPKKDADTDEKVEAFLNDHTRFVATWERVDKI